MSDTGATAEPDKGPGLGGIGESQSFDVSNDTTGSDAGSRVAPDRRRYSLDDVDIVAEEEEEQGGGAGEEDSVSEAANSRDQSESEDDEEIRLAKEMALAIAQNPNMTPDELKKLQEKSRKKASGGGAGKKMKRAVKKSIKVGVKGVAKGASKVKGKVKGAVSSSFSNKSSGGGKDSVPSTPSESGGGAPLSINTETPSPAAAGGRNRMKSADSTSSGILDAALSVREHFASTDGTPAAASGAPSIRMTGIVWKRRSGFGKYSSHAAWERRRVILQGTRLVYFKTNMDSKDDDGSHTDANDAVEDLQHQGGAASDDEQLFMPTPTADVGGSGGAMSFLPFRHGSLTTPSNNDNARGGIDLLKDQASISASYGHSGAPTPFALSIKVMSQTKWKLCFDTHQELMQWLGAMTDVVVEGSVDAYNAQILEQHDPTHGAGANYGQLSEPPKGLAASDDVTTSDAAGHRLWAPGNYHVRSDNYSADIIPEDELEEVNSDDDDDDVVVSSKAASGNVLVAGAPPEIDFVIDPSTGADFWGIPANRLFPAIVLLNGALCLSRVSSLSSDFFWHLLTFVNVALVVGLSKEKVGGKVLPKGTASSRNYIRRLSSGIAVSEPGDALSAAVDTSKRGAAKVKEDAKIPEPSEQDYKPTAGTTTMKIKNPTDLPVNKEGVIFGGWKSGDSSIMNIRSVGYKKHKEKVPSPGELYNCINVDIFESRTRFPDMASRVTLPKVDFKDDKGPKTWNAPDLFVISIAIPTDPPKLYGNTENGGGYTITMYYAMKQETRDILRRVTADGYDPSSEPNGDDPNKTQVNAVRLLDEWCRRAPTDDAFMARFKVVPNAQNLKEIGLPSWISKYNGKPFLIKRPGQTGFLYRHPDKSCIEFDISLHPFPYLAKQGICFMKETYFKKVLVTFGFLVEGRSDDELPECLIGLFQLCYPDPVHAIQGEDFFAGKSPRSF